MFRSSIFGDRKVKTRTSSHDSNSTKEKTIKVKTVDGNNNNNNVHKNHNNNNNSSSRFSHINRSRLDNNFDFIEPCDIEDELNNEIDSLDSIEIKNWRYHLTNNRF